MARRHQHEEHQNHEAWAIPYGDLVTLLLAFFVVMYAMSSVNEGKYRVLSNALNAAFRGTPTTPELIPIGTHELTLQEQLPASEVTRLLNAGMPVQRGGPLPRLDADSRDASAKATLVVASNEDIQAHELARVEADVAGVLESLIKTNAVQVRLLRDAVEVQIGADILFESGAAEPVAGAKPILHRLAEALAPWPNAVRVEGHTDNVPVRGGSYRSNWELSGARAGSVVRLFAENGIDPQRLEIIGYGEQRPIQPNTTPAGRNANRRVVVLILGRESTATSAHL